MRLTANRAGFTLIDLVIAIVLLAVLGGAITRTWLGQRHALTAFAAQTSARRALDQASLWLRSELAPASRQHAMTDLLVVAAESLTYRATRGLGLGCQVRPDAVDVTLADLSAWRRPQAGRDSLRVYLGLDSSGQGQWLPGPITAVAPATCGGAAALRLLTALDSARLAQSDVPHPPVRIDEVMQLRFYRSLGAWWLGARSVSAGEGLQPVAGPFVPGGLQLVYRDSLGQPTVVPAQVRRLELRLAAGSDTARMLILPRNLQ